MLMTMKNKRILRLFPVPNVLIFPISPRFAGHQVVQISRRGYSIELFPSFPCGLSFLPYVYGLGFGLSQKAIESRGCSNSKQEANEWVDMTKANEWPGVSARKACSMRRYYSTKRNENELKEFWKRPLSLEST